MSYRNILLIDDDQDDQEIFSAAVEKISSSLSYTIRSNASEALEHLSLKLLQPDLIFLDLNMPLMNGEEFLMAIKKNDSLKGIPIVIFSTSSNRVTKKLTMEMGAFNFYTKPDRFDKFVILLQTILG